MRTDPLMLFALDASRAYGEAANPGRRTATAHRPGDRVARSTRATFVALSLAASTLAGAAAQSSSDAVRDLVERGTRGELRQPVSTEARDALSRFYAPRVYAPAWFAGDQPAALAASALAQLRAAPTHGLDAEDYAVAALTREAQAIADGDRSPERVARAMSRSRSRSHATCSISATAA